MTFLPYKFSIALAVFMAVILSVAFPVGLQAQEIQKEAVADIKPKTTMDVPAVQNTGENTQTATHPVLYITQDKSEMIKLNQEAASVIVGNPTHISVLLDTPNTLVVVPRAAGASHFSVIGKDGSVVMERHVVVGAPKEQYVRIRRSCAGDSRNCQATSTYFCPDSCYEVREDGGSATSRRR